MRREVGSGGSSATPLSFYPKRASNIGLLLVCSAFVAIGITMGQRGEWPGFLGAAFFGIGVPIAVIQLIPGSAFLRIDSEGITFANLFRETSLPWSAFDEFFVVRIGVNQMVGFNFAPTYDRARLGRAVAKVLATCEGALPDTYGEKVEELVALLNTRLKASRDASAQPIPGQPRSR